MLFYSFAERVCFCFCSCPDIHCTISPDGMSITFHEKAGNRVDNNANNEVLLSCNILISTLQRESGGRASRFPRKAAWGQYGGNLD